MSSRDNIERLFLLEILVDNVQISTSELNLDPRTLSSLKQTVVRFQFLNYPALEISEEDFSPSKGNYEGDKISFKSGKSCLFALKGQHPSAFSPPFNMKVTVSRIMANNKPCTIGKTCIKLGECFATIVNCCIVCPESPTSKTIKETFPLVDDENCEIGSITVFIRLSCFGKLIVTQFQLGGLENKSFLFRADSESLKKEEEPKEEKIIIPTQYKEGPISKPLTFCEAVGSEGVPTASTRSAGPCPGPMMQGSTYPGMGMPNMGMMPPPMMPPGMGGMMPMPGFGSMMPSMPANSMQLMPLTNFGGDGGSPEMKVAPSSDYKELTASVNGHELCIRILRKPKKPKETKVLSRSESSSNERLREQEKIKQAFCDCDVPIPKEIMDIRCKPHKKKSSERKEPCSLLTGSSEPSRGYKMSVPKGASFPALQSNYSLSGQPQMGNTGVTKVSGKENFILKLGNCPPLCYKVPEPYPLPPDVCITDRFTEFEECELEKSKKLFEEYMAAKAKSAGQGKEGDKGKGGKGKGGKKGKKK